MVNDSRMMLRKNQGSMESLKSLGAKAKILFNRVWNHPVDKSVTISNSDLNKILAVWELGTAHSTKILSGGSSSNWLVETPNGKYVLRNAGKNSDYIDFQIFI